MLSVKFLRGKNTLIKYHDEFQTNKMLTMKGSIGPALGKLFFSRNFWIFFLHT